MARDVSDATPIRSRAELIDWIASGEKPRQDWRVGTEHEKIPFYRESAAPVPYEGERGIKALLENLEQGTRWEPIPDGGNIIGLAGEALGGGAISLEPGGQFELSGAPLNSIHDTVRETSQHLRATAQAADPLGIGLLTLGMSPLWTRAETAQMPKSRY